MENLFEHVAAGDGSVTPDSYQTFGKFFALYRHLVKWLISHQLIKVKIAERSRVSRREETHAADGSRDIEMNSRLFEASWIRIVWKKLPVEID
jgi:hypothetical protein